MLPAETARAWRALEKEPLLADAILVGGTALALRIQHRLSEDLDFLFPSVRLPRTKLRACVQKLMAAGWRVAPADDAASFEEFLISGMDLHDYQQDFLLDDQTKISFFAGDAAALKLLSSAPHPSGPRVAELQEVFALKAILSASRSKSRDWFDLYVLLRDHGFTIHHFAQAFTVAGLTTSLPTAFSRLCTGHPGNHDEGYSALLPDAPTPEQLSAFFRKQRDVYEAAEAARAFAQHSLEAPAAAARPAD